MRKYIYYELEALEPLIMGDHSEVGNLVKTNDYITGITILGLFAALYVKKYHTAYLPGDKVYKEDFKTLFLSDAVHYHNAYPIHRATGGKSIPMPMSVFGCKYFGESSFDSTEEEHGVEDTVFEDIRTLAGTGDFRCGICEQDMKHKDGYLFHYQGKLFTHHLKKRIDMHINVDSEQLYSFEAIEKDVSFYGYISIREELFSPLLKILKECANLKPGATHVPLRIGKAKNRGYGLIRLPNRFKTAEYPFNKAIALRDDGLLSVYCHSDLILKNDAGQFVSWLEPEQIHDGLELEKDRSYWKNDEYRGFNQKRKMPLERQMTVKKGSVFVYRVKTDNFNADTLPESIGELQNHGFGKLIYNHNDLKEF